MNALGPRIKALRQQRDLLQKHLAEKAGLTASMVSQIEAGCAYGLQRPRTACYVTLPGRDGTQRRGHRRREVVHVALYAHISSAEALKRTLLNAKSIAYSGDGASGICFKSVLERLGIAAEMNPKLKPLGSSAVVPSVGNGEVELSVISPPAILAEPGAELVGILPKELQNYVVYTAGVSAATKDADAAKALLKYLTTPAAMSVMKSKGLEPVPP